MSETPQDPKLEAEGAETPEDSTVEQSPVESEPAADTPEVASESAEAAPGPTADARAFKPQVFDKPHEPEAHFGRLGLLDDVELDVRIELGRTDMYIEDVLRLGEGSVVQLDKNAGDPVDIYVNDRLVARGEVLVLNENFCVRVNDIISPIPEPEGT